MISVIGSGKWGSAIAHAIGQNHSVGICPFRPKQGDFISLQRAKQSHYLVFALSVAGIKDYLKENFALDSADNSTSEICQTSASNTTTTSTTTNEISLDSQTTQTSASNGATTAAAATLSQTTKPLPHRHPHKVLIASKGIVKDEFLHDIFGEYFYPQNICALSGPSFAAEVIKDLPTALVISGQSTVAQEFARFLPDYIKTYIDDDIIGAEICGAYKNIIAIASGICDGLELGNNARAALISRGLIEIARFGRYFGAKDETFMGLSGAGDLFLTASSTLSRNYRVGYQLALGDSLDTIIARLGEVAEGVNTTRCVCLIARKHGIYAPIASQVAQILDGKPPRESLKDLLLRQH